MTLLSRFGFGLSWVLVGWACSAKPSAEDSSSAIPAMLEADLPPDLDRLEDYEVQRPAIAQARGRVERQGGQLRLRLGSGQVVTLVDTLVEGDASVRYDYLGYTPEIGLHVIDVGFYEGGTYIVLHDATGQEKRVPGAPLLAPDRRRFVASSWDLVAGYDPNRLEIWKVDSSGLSLEFELDGGQDWGPDSVVWAGNAAVQFRRVRLQGETVAYGPPERVVRFNGEWAAEASAP